MSEITSAEAPLANSGIDRPAVSIIIPHYNDLENLGQCLALLKLQTFARDQIEVIVAENNSSCGAAAVESLCGGFARVVPAPIQGAAEARNAGVRASRGKVLAFIDSDCRPEPEWLACGVAALAKADLVGGRIDVAVVDPANPTAVEAFEQVFAFDYRRYIEKQGFAVTANMFAPREIFDKVGGFRTGFAEDRDWGRRAVKLGYRWFCASDAIVSHPARRDWVELTKKWQRLTKEAFAGVKEQSAWRMRWLARSFLLLPSPFFHVAKILKSHALNETPVKWRAIGVLFAIRFWRFGQNLRLLLG